MIKEASLITKAGIPVWVKSSGPSIVSGILTGAMLGALSMFSSEITGQSLKTIEMSGGFMLHIRPFYQGELNLAIIGEKSSMGDPELQTIIQQLDEDIGSIFSSSAFDNSDANMIQILLETHICRLDDWFETKVFVESALVKERSEQVVEITSQLTLMSANLVRDKVAVLILNSSLQPLYVEYSPSISNLFFDAFLDHLRGWVLVSAHQNQLLPKVIFFDYACVGLGVKRNIYIICAMNWKGSMGDSKVTNKVRSWVSLLSRRIVL